MRISGLVEFGSVSSIGGATLAGFDLPTAQQLFDKPGKLDQILLAAKDGVSTQQLVEAVQKVLPEGTQVRSADDQAAQDAEGTSSFLTFFRTFLLVFGGIALFVGSFVIANSLSITIAQRTREFATLRTLGASRRQVLGSVVSEALVTGLVVGGRRAVPRTRDRYRAVQDLRCGRVSRCPTTGSCSAPGRSWSPWLVGDPGHCCWPACGRLGVRRGCRRSLRSGKAPSCHRDASTASARWVLRCSLCSASPWW